MVKITRGGQEGQEVKINNTEKCLVYFLYYKFLNNNEECFSIDRLVLEIKPDGKGKSEGYIKNAITEINKKVKGLVTKNKTNMVPFIKRETNRGYHLNPKLFKVTKNKE